MEVSMKNLLKLALTTAVLFQIHGALAFQITPIELGSPIELRELEALTPTEFQELLRNFYKTLTESDLLFFSSQILAEHRTNGDRKDKDKDKPKDDDDDKK
jgi:hypothetical protein